MKSKFKVGDKVVLKQQTSTYPLETYSRWDIFPGIEYTIKGISTEGILGILLNHEFWVSSDDIELSYSEMLKKVLE